jgi:hypothetical protein
MESSVLESAAGRGDRRLCDVIETAWKNGAKFDLWWECFNFEIWREAFKQHGMDIETAAQRQFSTEETLPWEHLGGPDKNYLLKHFDDAMEKTRKYSEHK